MLLTPLSLYSEFLCLILLTFMCSTRFANSLLQGSCLWYSGQIFFMVAPFIVPLFTDLSLICIFLLHFLWYLLPHLHFQFSKFTMVPVFGIAGRWVFMVLPLIVLLLTSLPLSLSFSLLSPTLHFLFVFRYTSSFTNPLKSQGHFIKHFASQIRRFYKALV